MAVSIFPSCGKVSRLNATYMGDEERRSSRRDEDRRRDDRRRDDRRRDDRRRDKDERRSSRDKKLSVGTKVSVKVIGHDEPKTGTIMSAGERLPELPKGDDPDLWYGVALDEPLGKHDGMLGERRVFQCADKCGMFVVRGAVTVPGEKEESRARSERRDRSRSRSRRRRRSGGRCARSPSRGRSTRATWSA